MKTIWSGSQLRVDTCGHLLLKFCESTEPTELTRVPPAAGAGRAGRAAADPPGPGGAGLGRQPQPHRAGPWSRPPPPRPPCSPRSPRPHHPPLSRPRPPRPPRPLRRPPPPPRVLVLVVVVVLVVNLLLLLLAHAEMRSSALQSARTLSRAINGSHSGPTMPARRQVLCGGRGPDTMERFGRTDAVSASLSTTKR